MSKHTLKLECSCGHKQELKRAGAFFAKVEKGLLSSCMKCTPHVNANYLHKWVMKEETNIF